MHTTLFQRNQSGIKPRQYDDLLRRDYDTKRFFGLTGLIRSRETLAMRLSANPARRLFLLSAGWQNSGSMTQDADLMAAPRHGIDPSGLLHRAGVNEAQRAVFARLAHGVERVAAASGARLLHAGIRAFRTLHERRRPAVRQKQWRTAAATGERTGQRRKQCEAGRAERRARRAICSSRE